MKPLLVVFVDQINELRPGERIALLLAEGTWWGTHTLHVPTEYLPDGTKEGDRLTITFEKEQAG